LQNRKIRCNFGAPTRQRRCARHGYAMKRRDCKRRVGKLNLEQAATLWYELCAAVLRKERKNHPSIMNL
jgi:hypothetical protein